MNTFKSRIAQLPNRNTMGLSLFAGLALLTALGLGAAKEGLLPAGAGTRSGPGPVTLSGTLSQTTIVQNGDHTVYLDVVLDVPPNQPVAGRHTATDVVVVLDRSGSMGAANKLPFAKAALHDIVARLDTQDRFALVSFANQAIVHTPLVAVSRNNRDALARMIDSIGAGGGTNLGDGLARAMTLVENGSGTRARKVMLLSDGEANQGITDPTRLAEMARRLTTHEAVLSTVGLGLGFNETLMASLADHGMGNYAYLEQLSGLDRMLAAELSASRQIFANSSHLEIKLGNGARLLDAGGYPIDRRNDAVVTVATGQLLADTGKRFIMTFQVPNDRVTEYPLADIALVYNRHQNRHQIGMANQPLMLAVVAPERRAEAIRSIDASAYKDSWLKNNLGRMQNSLSQWLREGKKDKAKSTLADYRTAVKTAEAASPVPLLSKEMDAALDAMETTIDEAFSGSREDQQVKRNRAAKSLQYSARQEQRSTE